MTRIAFGAWLALALVAGSARGAQVADWQFQGTLADSIGAPALTPVVEPDGAFVAQAVGANPARTVRTFSAGGGFAVSAAGLIDDSGYTVSMLVRLDQATSYRRLFDPSGGNSDSGLYVYFGNLMLYPNQEGTTGAFTEAAWHQVTLTRAGNGEARGYIDGLLQFIVLDGAAAGAVLQPANLLRFLVDDGGENASGAVARIRLWNTVLPGAQVAALDDNQGDRIFIDGYETFSP